MNNILLSGRLSNLVPRVALLGVTQLLHDFFETVLGCEMLKIFFLGEDLAALVDDGAELVVLVEDHFLRFENFLAYRAGQLELLPLSHFALYLVLEDLALVVIHALAVGACLVDLATDRLGLELE